MAFAGKQLLLPLPLPLFWQLWPPLQLLLPNCLRPRMDLQGAGKPTNQRQLLSKLFISLVELHKNHHNVQILAAC